MGTMVKIIISKQEEIIEKIPFERCAYESVDDRSLSSDIYQKATNNTDRFLKD